MLPFIAIQRGEREALVQRKVMEERHAEPVGQRTALELQLDSSYARRGQRLRKCTEGGVLSTAPGKVRSTPVAVR